MGFVPGISSFSEYDILLPLDWGAGEWAVSPISYYNLVVANNSAVGTVNLLNKALVSYRAIVADA